jgi:hypothetical protein
MATVTLPVRGSILNRRRTAELVALSLWASPIRTSAREASVGASHWCCEVLRNGVLRMLRELRLLRCGGTVVAAFVRPALRAAVLRGVAEKLGAAVLLWLRPRPVPVRLLEPTPWVLGLTVIEGSTRPRRNARARA